MTNKRHILVVMVVLLSMLQAFVFNEWNLKKLPETSKRKGQTVKTLDDPSYINPAVNYLEKGVWEDQNLIGNTKYYTRPPGYGWLISVFNVLFGEQYLNGLKYFQLLMFGLSVYLLFFVADFFLKQYYWSLLTIIIYGVLPIGSGFLYYSLTEGITPALVILYLFLIIRSKNSFSYLFWACLCFGLLFVIRPVLGFLVLLIPVVLYKDKKPLLKLAYENFIYLFIAFAPMLGWQLRNYSIEGKWVGLHPIYHNTNNGFYRPVTKAIYAFAKGWAATPATFNKLLIPQWQATVTTGTKNKQQTEKLYEMIPEKYQKVFTKEQVAPCFEKYLDAVVIQSAYYKNKTPMPNNLPKEEKEAIACFNSLTETFKQKFWWDYHVASPLKVYKTMAFHSNLSLYIFQTTFRGKWWMEGLRMVCFGIHSLVFILFLGLFFIKKDWLTYVGLLVIPFLYLFYLSYFQRGVEERYTLPVLSVLMLGSLKVIKTAYDKVFNG